MSCSSASSVCLTSQFCGINGLSSRHLVSSNSFIKDTDGYHGGWGVDMATGTDCVVTGNILVGGSTGVHLSGSSATSVSGNHIDAIMGIWMDAAWWPSLGPGSYSPARGNR
jgi:parallel beta-helix repeat protein